MYVCIEIIHRLYKVWYNVRFQGVHWRLGTYLPAYKEEVMYIHLKSLIKSMTGQEMESVRICNIDKCILTQRE